MNDSRLENSRPRLLTVDAVLKKHEQLLTGQTSSEDGSQISSFVDELMAIGVYFDEAFERKAIQGTLDYWTSELIKHQTDEETAGQRRRTIREFNADALKALQGEFANPFAGLSARIESLKTENGCSPSAILSLVGGIAEAAQLRFQQGLLKEMASQVTEDPSDGTLLEFCLWHLFEDTQTRLGNKIYRPRKLHTDVERIDFFSCKIYLIHKADQMRTALPQAAADALIDALMNIAAKNTDADRARPTPQSLVAKLVYFKNSLWWPVRSKGEYSGQFELYDEKGLSLAEFLQRSRLAFYAQSKWNIVHPALAERWDPLKKRMWEAEQKQKRREAHVLMISAAAGAAVLTSLGWFAWYAMWTNAALEHLAKAQFSSTPTQRLSESVAGLQASKLSMGVDESYLSQVANDALGAVIGERAKQARLGELPGYPSIPGIECERTPVLGGSDSYSVKMTSDFAPPGKLLAMDTCPTFTLNLAGTLLAAAWDKRDGVNIKVFQITSGFHLASGKDGALTESDLKEDDAPWMRTNGLKPLPLVALLNKEPKRGGSTACKDRSLRFSSDDRVVTFECLYSTDSGNELEWIPRAVAGSLPDTAAHAPRNVFNAIQQIVLPQIAGGSVADKNRVASIFLGPGNASELQFVTVKSDGHVQVWRDGKDGPLSTAQFNSDFVRVGTSGRPTLLDVQDNGEDALYAISALIPYPVIRIYQQHRSGHARHATLVMEHYPPAGVGTPVGMKFTPKAHCLDIGAKWQKGHSLELLHYHLVLDADRLLPVSQALKSDLELDPAGTKLPKYSEAIKKHCYGA